MYLFLFFCFFGGLGRWGKGVCNGGRNAGWWLVGR